MNGERVSQVWTDLLQLPGFAVVHLEQDSTHQRYFITVAPEHAINVCPQCHRTCGTPKQRRSRDSHPGDCLLPRWGSKTTDRPNF